MGKNGNGVNMTDILFRRSRRPTALHLLIDHIITLFAAYLAGVTFCFIKQNKTFQRHYRR